MKNEVDTDNSRQVSLRVILFLDEKERELVEKAILFSPEETGGERKFTSFVKKTFVRVASTLVKMNEDKEKVVFSVSEIHEIVNPEMSKSKKKEFTIPSEKGKSKIPGKTFSVKQKESNGMLKTVWIKIDRNVLDFLRKNFNLPELFKTCYLLAAKRLIEHFTGDSEHSSV